MTRKQIDARRETRLWITTIIVPALTFTASMMAIPEVRGWVKSLPWKFRIMKQKIKNKFKKS